MIDRLKWIKVLIKGKMPFFNSGGKNFGTLAYRCNVCGSACETEVVKLGREVPSCRVCGSTVRMRVIVHLLSMELFGKSLAIPDFPKRPDIRGIGMSDWFGYAVPLGQKLGYTNTYYHKEPKLDITSVDASPFGKLDFIISSDVFEHVPPPVSVAFENTRKLLKPGGVFIFTVPYSLEPETKEHFPDLYKYEIMKKGDGYILKNMTREGVEETFDNLVFHGGPGSTLEMRLFSEDSLKRYLSNAGFTDIKVRKEPVFEYGIYWSHENHLPIVARVEQ